MRSLCSNEVAETNAAAGFEEPPTEGIQIPYWQLKAILMTVRQGGFLTPSVFIPKAVWTQVGVKFTGLSAKNAAFQDTIMILVNWITLKPMPKDDGEIIKDHTLVEMLHAFKYVMQRGVQTLSLTLTLNLTLVCKPLMLV